VFIDLHASTADNYDMSTETASSGMKDLTDAVKRMMNGVRDPALAKKAREDMDRTREEIRKRIGTVEVAVDLIRDARDQ
jgi:hypothetical protein